MEETIKAEGSKTLMKTARVVSAVFTPFSIPFVAFLVLFLFSYLSITPPAFKLLVLVVVYGFTILMPTVAIFVFRKIHGFTPGDLAVRRHRYVPFLLTILSYAFCLLVMHRLRLPWYMNGIILVALLVSVAGVAVNVRWKLSEHMAGAGAVIGGVVSFGALFGYNPVGWLCLFILVAGMLGSARITLGHHTLGEVVGGLAVGLCCSLAVLHPGSLLLIHVFSRLLF